MLESSLYAEDQFCHLHFTGSFWDGACYVRRPGPRPKQLHLDAFHVAHLAPCGLHGGDGGLGHHPVLDSGQYFSVAVWVVVVVNINLVDPNTGHSKSDPWPSILCFCCCS